MSLELQKNNAALVAEYLDYCRYKEFSRDTIVNYEVSMRNLYDFCLENEIELEKVSVATMVNYTNNFLKKEKTYAPSTIVAKLAAIKTFYDYLQMTSRATYNPVVKQLYPKVVRKKREPLRGETLKSLLNYIKTHAKESYYFGALLMAFSGLRISEVENLRLNRDIEYKEDSVYLKIRGKGAKDRTVPVFSAEAVDLCYLLKKKMETEPAPIKDTGVIEINRKLGINKQVIQYHINKWEEETNQAYHYSCHDFRRGFAQRAMEDYKDIEIVRYLMGHESYNTTLIYLYTDERNVYELEKKLVWL